MIELLSEINYLHWLAFGLLLLIAELLGTGGYLLWMGISALIVGALMNFIPMSWQLQWMSFGALSLATTWLWWRRQLKSDQTGDASRKLNQKESQLVGQEITLDEDVVVGTNRVKLGDTTWSARSSVEITAGSRVKVVDVDGIILVIEPIEA
ncbi:hypothetical protein CS022_17745 [Veronia nyctiphanis]|uniref:NfeD-like C-terminal domain-containing protein n=1 Tax=Veronia nyctiphanis TaxID=1278244 RepID=A0A4Q0YNQ8_9GAMM|nr:NfeD family protein [Veronia nyctiphanis]RXJ72113.1 hypothetical protein CS022_17745 [Veronia nyctiphanis]